ncbi:hypothetical protein ONK27_26095, partial [Salmonella enterica subsp. enterica serovar Virginia]|nr:hypothetical protein [Salmonella enterica subsp. enterica serovar Virginia]
FSLPLRATSFTATLVTLYLHPEAELRPFEIPCFLSNYAESLAYLTPNWRASTEDETACEVNEKQVTK